MADGRVVLNPGAAGAAMDEEAVDYGGGDTRFRSRVVLGGDTPDALILPTNGAPDPAAYGLPIRAIPQAAEWSVVGEANGEGLVLTKVGEAGMRHYVSGFFLAYNSLVTGAGMVIESPSGTPVFETFVHSQRDVDFSKATRCPVGADVILRLDAGGSNVSARGTIQGYTR
jgi:hypothetical protein